MFKDVKEDMEELERDKKMLAWAEGVAGDHPSPIFGEYLEKLRQRVSTAEEKQSKIPLPISKELK